MTFKTAAFYALIIASASLVASSACAEDDWEYWGHVTMNYKLTEKLAFKLMPNFRVRDDFADPYYWEMAQGLAYGLHKHIDAGLYYIYAEEDRADTNRHEHRFRPELTLKANWKGLKFSDRSRYEYRAFNRGASRERYRNMLQVSFSPVTIHRVQITPYVSNEFFYDLDLNEYNHNRGSVGFSRKLTDSIKLGLYYMCKSSKTAGHWEEAHVIGAKFDIDLN